MDDPAGGMPLRHECFVEQLSHCSRRRSWWGSWQSFYDLQAGSSLSSFQGEQVQLMPVWCWTPSVETLFQSARILEKQPVVVHTTYRWRQA